MSGPRDRDGELPRRDETPGQFTAGDAAQDGGHGETVDLTVVQADDALLDALGSSDPDVSGPLGDDQLNSLLLSWRHEVDSQPIAELVDTDTAVHVVAAARSTKLSRRKRFLVPLTSAAAVLVIAFSVVGMAARSAQPGDTLWGVTQVLYSTHAQSVETASSARHQLEQARTMIYNGDIEDARAMLAKVSKSLNVVQGEDGKSDLSALHDQLLNQLKSPDQSNHRATTRQPADTSSSSPAKNQPTKPDPRKTSPQPPTSKPNPSTSPSTPPSSTPPPSSATSSSPSAPGSEHASSTGDSPNASRETFPIPPPN